MNKETREGITELGSLQLHLIAEINIVKRLPNGLVCGVTSWKSGHARKRPVLSKPYIFYTTLQFLLIDSHLWSFRCSISNIVDLIRYSRQKRYIQSTSLRFKRRSNVGRLVSRSTLKLAGWKPIFALCMKEQICRTLPLKSLEMPRNQI